MFMQAGFAMVETGFTRAKNAAHTITMNFMVYGIAMLAYWAIGFALQAGGVGALGTLGGYDKLAHEFSLRSEEHTSELQSRSDLVCRLLLEKKKRGSPPAFVRLTSTRCDGET